MAKQNTIYNASQDVAHFLSAYGKTASPPDAHTQEKPVLLLVDQKGTLNKAHADALHTMGAALKERGIPLYIRCQSKERSDTLEDFYDYWAPGGTLRSMAHPHVHWHGAGETAALNGFNKDDFASVIAIQDTPPQRNQNLHVVMHSNTQEPQDLVNKLLPVIGKDLGLERSGRIIHFGGKFDTHAPVKTYEVGGKAEGLIKMLRLAEENPELDIKVPKGFVITADASVDYLKNGKNITSDLHDDIMHAFETKIDEGKTVSVRSGAAVSMAGAQKTVLHVGMRLDTLKAKVVSLAKNTHLTEQQRGARLAEHAFHYGQFIKTFSEAVLEPGLNDEQRSALKKELDELALDVEFMQENPVETLQDVQHDLASGDAISLVDAFSDGIRNIEKVTGQNFPRNDTKQQLIQSIGGVMSSWDSPAAQEMRKVKHISDDMGTAVTVQEMVTGLSGVVFTRDTQKGHDKLIGHYGSGDQVVSGTFGAQNIDVLARAQPEEFKKLHAQVKFLEADDNYPQDIEFVIDRQDIYLLQTRRAKMSPEAKLRVSRDMVIEAEQNGDKGKIQKALLIGDETITNNQGYVFPTFIEPAAKKEATPIAVSTDRQKITPVVARATSGTLVFSSDYETAEDVKAAMANVENPMLVINQENFLDSYSIGREAEGVIIFGYGSSSSHVAVAAKEHSVPCCIIHDESVLGELRAHSRNASPQVSLGENGSVYKGTLPIQQGPINPDAKVLLEYDHKYRDSTETPGGKHAALRASIQNMEDSPQPQPEQDRHPSLS